MNISEFSNLVTALSGIIEKSFALAEANAERRHKENMFSLQTERVRVDADAEKLRAEARKADAEAKQILSSIDARTKHEL